MNKDNAQDCASKAGSFERVYEIMSEESMGIAAVSGGEMYMASLEKPVRPCRKNVVFSMCLRVLLSLPSHTL